ncbi:uncharacterized protein LOC110072541 isoform X3 [Pogona vitticeps]
MIKIQLKFCNESCGQMQHQALRGTLVFSRAAESLRPLPEEGFQPRIRPASVCEFPETYIGDSEEVRGTTPAGKKHLGSQRDGRSVSPPSANSGQQDRENVASPRELEVPSFNQELPPEGEGHRDEETDVPGEEQLAPRCVPEEDGEGTQKPLNPQNTNLLGFRWLQGEEDDRDVRQENASNPLETVSGQETVSEGGGCEVLAVLWPPPGDNAEEHLEPRLNEVSLIDRFVPEEKLSPTLSRLGYPESSPGAQESPSPCDEEALRTESPASTGYFPCYRTYEELPCYRPNKQPEGPGRYRDAAVQCDRPEGATGREKRRAEAKKSLEEGKRPAAPPGSPQRQLPGGPRPASAGQAGERTSKRRPSAHATHSKPHFGPGAFGRPRPQAFPPQLPRHCFLGLEDLPEAGPSASWTGSWPEAPWPPPQAVAGATRWPGPPRAALMPAQKPCRIIYAETDYSPLNVHFPLLAAGICGPLFLQNSVLEEASPMPCQTRCGLVPCGIWSC